MEIKMSIKEAAESIIDCLNAGKVPCLIGQPGAGKSDIMDQVIEQANLLPIDVRLSTIEPYDLTGVVRHDEQLGKAQYVPFDTFPVEGDKLPKDKDGWAVKLDEITSADPSTLAASYKFILDRAVGQHNLHENVVIIAAGNASDHGAIANELGTALTSRMVMIYVEPSISEFEEWWIEQGKDHRVPFFLRTFPDCFNNFRPDATDQFACPRTWDTADSLLEVWDEDEPIKQLNERQTKLLCGAVGTAAGVQFKTFIDVIDSIVPIEDMISKPEEVSVPTEPSQKWAMAATISSYLNKDNAAPLAIMMNKIGAEFSSLILSIAIKRDHKLAGLPEMRPFLIKISRAATARAA